MASLIPCIKAMITAPIIVIPQGLSRNPRISASIAAFVSCSIKNEPIATNTHISMSKYSIAVPILSKNVKNAVRILSDKLIGNKIIFIIHLIDSPPPLLME